MNRSSSYLLTTVGVDSNDSKSIPSGEYLKRIKTFLTPLEEYLLRIGMPPDPIIIRIESCNLATDDQSDGVTI